MKIRQKFRMYPNKEQERILNQWIGCARFVWNRFLEKNNERYKNEKKFVFYNEMNAQLTQLKKDQEYTWLNDAESTSLQQKLRDLEKAIKDSFPKNKNPKKYPYFKAKKTDESGIRITNLYGHFQDGKIHLPKINTLFKVVFHEQLKGKPSSVTIIKDTCGCWFVSYVIEWDCDVEYVQPSEVKSGVGIDLGVKSFAITSDGEVFESPKYLRKSEKKLKKLQNRHSKKHKNSKNREKARKRLAKQHKRVANKRKNFIKQTASSIAKMNDVVVCEDLNVRGMVKNHHLAKSVSDSGFWMFLIEMDWQCRKRGKIFHKVSRWYPSSKTCNCCGYVNKTLTLNEREWVCPQCNSGLDRDYNASLNILDQGLRDLRINL